MADLNKSLNNAAAKPTREAPLTAIETRLRRRHRLRQGAVGVCAIALVGALGGGIALSTDDGPSIKAGLPPAAAQVTAGDPSISLTLPDGWVESPLGPTAHTDNEVFTVGTALLPTDTPHDVCLVDPAYQDDVFVQLKEFTGVVLLDRETPTTSLPETPTTSLESVAPLEQKLLPYEQRPADFATATPSNEAQCVRPGNDASTAPLTQEFQFQDNGRWLDALVGIGINASPEQRAQAYAALNSLEVAPLTDPPQPVVTTVPSTVPESADTQAITAAFLGWIDTRPIDASGVYIEDFATIRDAVIGAAEANGHPNDYTGRVDAITRIGENDADVIYSFVIDGQVVVGNMQGHAVKIDGVWLVSRDTVCEALLQGPVHCPPRL